MHMYNYLSIDMWTHSSSLRKASDGTETQVSRVLSDVWGWSLLYRFPRMLIDRGREGEGGGGGSEEWMRWFLWQRVRARSEWGGPGKTKGSSFALQISMTHLPMAARLNVRWCCLGRSVGEHGFEINPNYPHLFFRRFTEPFQSFWTCVLPRAMPLMFPVERLVYRFPGIHVVQRSWPLSPQTVCSPASLLLNPEGMKRLSAL